jgi:polar amino acid transport system permease protein
MLWSWQTFSQELTNLGFAHAAWTTFWSATVVEAAAVVGGFTLALASRSGQVILRLAAGVYVWIWRGTPLLVQLLIVYFGLPQIGIRLGVLGSGITTFILTESGYRSVFAAGALIGVPSGQYDASKMIGFTGWPTFRLIILPQAFRLFVPVLGNQFNYMLKTTSLLSIISLVELTRYSEIQVSLTYQPSEVFAVAALYYLALTILWSGVQYLLEAKFSPSRATNRPTKRRARKAIIRQLAPGRTS